MKKIDKLQAQLDEALRTINEQEERAFSCLHTFYVLFVDSVKSGSTYTAAKFKENIFGMTCMLYVMEILSNEESERIRETIDEWEEEQRGN